ncbi:MAG TPA: nucleoside monophosphate kinase [Patescibacteria group bacterium]|nr:nucleoside monophosphate kinase [Patescibacteria group bacterium]
MKIVLIGIQGSGKSTQGNMLSQKLNIPYLSTGHIFREMAREHTSFGRYIKETMNAGYLIPDDKTLEIVSEYLNRPEYKNGYILDGFPRTEKQAHDFSNGIDRLVYIMVPDDEALRRLSTRDDGREDAASQALKKRVELFHKFTEPVIDYYRNKNELVEINGVQDIEKVHEDICKALNI